MTHKEPLSCNLTTIGLDQGGEEKERDNGNLFLMRAAQKNSERPGHAWHSVSLPWSLRCENEKLGAWEATCTRAKARPPTNAVIFNKQRLPPFFPISTRIPKRD